MEDLLNELENSNQSHAAKMVARGLVVALFFASALTTFSFFASYAPNVGAFGGVVGAGVAPIISGIIGVTLLDAAGLAWTVVRAHACDTEGQFTVATAAAFTAISLALITSALQVALSVSFVGDLSDSVVIQALGVMVVTLGFCVNFAAMAIWLNSSFDTIKATQRNYLKAQENRAAFILAKESRKATLRERIAATSHMLPELARAQGARDASDFVNRQFSDVVEVARDKSLPRPAPDFGEVVIMAADAPVTAVMEKREDTAPSGDGENFTTP